MASSFDQELRAQVAPLGNGSATGQRRNHAAAPVEVTMFGDLPDTTRLAMEAIVRRAATPDAALPLVIALLVPGGIERQAAIVGAITSNEPLREQWERTWQVLRG